MKKINSVKQNTPFTIRVENACGSAEELSSKRLYYFLVQNSHIRNDKYFLMKSMTKLHHTVQHAKIHACLRTRLLKLPKAYFKIITFIFINKLNLMQPSMH